jgi:hypothetical protein
MNIKQLEAFVRIVKNKSFSQTAKELYLTQPTVSSYISSLEADLGVQLFTRTTKEVHTTSEGEQIYLYAKDIVNLSNKIRNAFKEESKDDVNEIVISSSSIPGQYLLPGMLANFSKRHPNTEFRVHETDSNGAVTDVAEHRADIGFCGTIIPKTACTFLPFYEDELILITPNTPYYRKMQENNDLTFLAKADFVMREQGSGTKQEAMKILQKNGLKLEEMKVVARFGNTGAVLLSVKEGVGVAVVSKLAARSEIKNNEILSFPLQEGGYFRKIYMVSNSNYPLSKRAKSFVQMIQNLVEKKKLT